MSCLRRPNPLVRTRAVVGGLADPARHGQAAISDDLLLVAQAIAEFHRRFPMQTPLRGTSRTWISTTIETTAGHIEALLNP
jgi:hypothetical protein